MNRLSLRRMAICVLGVLLLVVPATPAAAVTPWRKPSCAVGDITNYRVELNAAGEEIIQVDGWTGLCESTPPREIYFAWDFALLFYAEPMGWVARLRTYTEKTSPTAFSFSINYTTEQHYGPVKAACLAFDYDKRLSCLAVDASVPAELPDVEPVPSDLVITPIDPACGHCLVPGD